MPGVMSTIISFITKYSGAGATAAAKGISNVRNATSIAARGIQSFGSVLAGTDGKLGQVAHSAVNMMTAIQQMGAIGGIMAGVQIAIGMVSDHFIKKCDAMREAAERLYDNVHARLERMNKIRMDEVNKALEDATTRADAAAKAFDTLAASYMKVEKAKVDTETSGANAALSGLTLEKSLAMAGAKSDNDRATIGAAYDERIAKAKLSATADAQSAAVAEAEDRLSQASTRADLAKRREVSAKLAMDKAAATYDEDVRTGNKGNVEKSKAARDAAIKAYDDAITNRRVKEADVEVADEQLKQAKDAQTAALNDARREVVEAASAARQLADAQLKSAKAELERERPSSGPPRRPGERPRRTRNAQRSKNVAPQRLRRSRAGKASSTRPSTSGAIRKPPRRRSSKTRSAAMI